MKERGSLSLDEKSPGSIEVCELCCWEDDNVQYDDPDYDGGANVPSLKQAQRNSLEFGASEKGCIEYVSKPNETDIKDVS